MNPSRIESALPFRLNFYGNTLLERLDFPLEPASIETVFEGETLLLQSRIPLTASRSQGLFLQFYGDPGALTSLDENAAYLELTNILGSRVFSRLSTEEQNEAFALSPPTEVALTEAGDALQPVGAYHLADPQTGESQGLLLLSLETRAKAGAEVASGLEQATPRQPGGTAVL